MGIVYKVRDLRMSGEIKALKIIKPSLIQNEHARQRFVQEARIAQKMGHPNIVKTFDLGEHAGLQFITMEYLEGHSLVHALQQRKKLSLKETLDITRQVLLALDYAHKTTIHRDLKPQNVFLCRDGTVKLLDFGLAHILGEEGLTLTGAVLGTPAYMAPEQLRGKEVSPRSDLYSLGVFIHQCLTGEFPSTHLDAPSARNAAVPRWLDRLVIQLLSPCPEDRPASACIVQYEIEKHFRSGDVELPITENGPPRPVKIPKRLLGCGAIAIFCLIISVILLKPPSSQRAPITVPDEASKTPAGAIDAITETGINPGMVTQLNCPTIRAGQTIGQEPAVGANGEPATAANFSVSSGPSPPKPPIPGAIEMQGMIAMVWCPPGQFLMGSPGSEKGRRDDEIQHRVTLTKGFWIGQYEVTQAQWKAVMGNNPSHVLGDALPVDKVSWEDCQEFIRCLNTKGISGFRLPTEAEWEYACRAGSATAFCFGNEASSLGDFAWHKENADNIMHEVGRKQENNWKIQDMHGNVWEWCQDWYAPYTEQEVTDYTGPAGGTSRTRRGGASSCEADYCRSAVRGFCLPHARIKMNGFRLCRDEGSQQVH